MKWILEKSIFFLPILLTACSKQNVNNPVVEPAPAVSVSLSVDGAMLLAGFCSKTNTISTVDLAGNQTPVVSEQIIRLSSSSSFVEFYSDSECSKKINSIKMPAGQKESNFYFKTAKSEYVTISANTFNLRPDTQSKTIISPDSSQIQFKGANQAIAGTCSNAMNLISLNYQGEETPVKDPIIIALSGNATGKFFDNDSCSGVPISATSIDVGSSQKNIYFFSSKTGFFDLIATAPGPIISKNRLSVKANSPAQLNFVSLPQSVEAGFCSNVFNIQVQDQQGNTSPLTAPTNIQLSGINLQFFSDSKCQSSPIQSIDLDAGTDSFSFYSKSLTVSETGVSISSIIGGTRSQTLTILPSEPNKLQFSLLQGKIVAGIPMPKISVLVLDRHGNISTSPSKTIQIQAFSDSQCTVLLNPQLQGFTQATSLSGISSFLSISYSDAGVIYLGAKTSGLISACSGPITINPDFPSKIIISGQDIMPAGTCTELSLFITDNLGNLSSLESDILVNPTAISTSAVGSFYLDNTCSSGMGENVKILKGEQGKRIYFSQNQAETVLIKILGFGSVPGAKSVKVEPAPAVDLVVSNPLNIIAGQCSSGFILKSKDIYGNDSPVLADTVISINNSGQAGTYYSDKDCLNPISSTTINKGFSTRSLYYKNSLAGPVFTTFTNQSITKVASFDVLPSVAKKFSIQAPPSVMAGSFFNQLKVTALDDYNNVVPGFSKPITIFAYSDTACSVAATPELSGTITVLPNLGESSFGAAKYTKAAFIHIGAKSEGVEPACSSIIQIIPVAPTNINLVSSDSILAGQCAEISVNALDDFNNLINAKNDLDISLLSSGNGIFYSNPACNGVTISNTIIKTNTNKSTFYFLNTKSEVAKLTANSSSLGSYSIDIKISPLNPQKLFIDAEANGKANDCIGPIDVQAQDKFGNLSELSSPSEVILSTTGSGQYYSDTSCLNSISTTRINAQANSSKLYFKNSKSETNILSVSAVGLTSSSKEIVIGALSPTKISVSGPIIASAGSCSSEIKITSRDIYDNISSVVSQTPISISNYGLGNFYTTSDCSGSSITGISIPQGQNSISIYYKSLISQQLNIGFSFLSDVKTYPLTIEAGASSKLTFSSDPKTIVAGNCSGAIILQSQDQFGNNVPVATNKLITLTGNNVTFFSNSSCSNAPINQITIPGGNESALFYISSTSTSANSISVSGIGTTISQNLTVLPGTANKIGFISIPSTGVSGSSVFTTQIISAVQDAFGNTIPSATDLVKVTAYSDSGCLNSNPTVFTGTLEKNSINGTATFSNLGFSGTGTIYIGASAVGLAPICSAPVLINAANPTKLFISGPSSIKAGVCSGPFTLTTKDAFDNIAPSPTGLVTTFSDFGLGSGKVYLSSSCQDSGSLSLVIDSNTSSKTFYIKSLLAGEKNVAVSSSLQSLTFPLTILNSDPAKIIISGSANPEVNTCTGYSLAIEDSFGNKIALESNQNLILSGKAGGDFYSDSTCSTPISSVLISGGNLNPLFYYKNSIVSQTSTINGSGVSGVSNYVGVPIKVAYPSPKILSALIGSENIAAGKCEPITLNLLDSNSQLTQSLSDVLVSLEGNGAGSYYSDNLCSTQINATTLLTGVNTKLIYFKSSTPATFNLIFSSTGLESAFIQLAINAGSASKLVIKSQPSSTVTAGITIPAFELYYADDLNNMVFSESAFDVSATLEPVVPGQTASLLGTTSVLPDETTGLITFSNVSIQKAGLFKIKFVGKTFSVTSTEILVNAAAPNNISIVSGNNQIAVTQSPVSDPLKVVVKDLYGNPTSGQTVIFSPTSGGGVLTPSSTLTTGDGTAQSSYTAGATIGTSVIQAKLSSFPAIAVNFSITVIGINKFTISGPSNVSKSVCSGPFLVEARDKNNNLTTSVVSTTSNLSTNNTQALIYSDSGCSIPVSSVIISANTNSKEFYIKNTSDTGFTITAAYPNITSGSLTVALYSFTVSPSFMDFGSTNSNIDKTLTITNNGSSIFLGSSDFAYSGIGFSSNVFSVRSNSCENITLSTGSSCSIIIRFSAANCNLSNGVNYTGSLNIVKVGLSVSFLGITSYSWQTTFTEADLGVNGGANCEGIYDATTGAVIAPVQGNSGVCQTRCSTYVYWTEAISFNKDGIRNSCGGLYCCRNTQQCL